MKKARYVLGSIALIAILAVIAGVGINQLYQAKAAGVTCTPTGFMRDGINLTAAVIDPAGTFSAKLNATGCNIGIYYHPGKTGKVSHAEIYGANYYGVVNDGGTVSIDHSFIHDIGNTPLDGTQHGVGIYFSFGSKATGDITDNKIVRYQKNGIAVNSAGKHLEISHNVVIGQGPVDYIAQNGIQIGYGASADITNNTVTGNAYTGAGNASSGGILIIGGPCYGGPYTTKTRITDNVATGNDVGVFISNLNAQCAAPLTPTRISISENKITNDAITNTSGNAPGAYQVGVSDAGDFDKITNNKICGAGYTPTSSPSFVARIDISYANNVTVEGNTMCSSVKQVTQQTQVQAQATISSSNTNHTPKPAK